MRILEVKIGFRDFNRCLLILETWSRKLQLVILNCWIDWCLLTGDVYLGNPGLESTRMNFDSPDHPNLYAVDHDFKEIRGETGLGSKLHMICNISYVAYAMLHTKYCFSSMSESLLLWFISTLFFLVVFCFIGKLRTVFPKNRRLDKDFNRNTVCFICHILWYVTYHMLHISQDTIPYSVLKTIKEKWSSAKINHLVQTVQWWISIIKGQEGLRWQPEDVPK